MKRKIVLHFSRDIWDKPIIYRLIKDFNLVLNILKANVLPKRESFMVLEIEGSDGDYRDGIEYLKECGVTIEPIEQDIGRDEEKCTHCGACTAICPTGALSIRRETMEVIFTSDMCSGCELCVPACPPRAMEVHIE
jgi:L-aspartate semialdehyde sulfurtransferase ferredoxin